MRRKREDLEISMSRIMRGNEIEGKERKELRGSGSSLSIYCSFLLSKS